MRYFFPHVRISTFMKDSYHSFVNQWYEKNVIYNDWYMEAILFLVFFSFWLELVSPKNSKCIVHYYYLWTSISHSIHATRTTNKGGDMSKMGVDPWTIGQGVYPEKISWVPTNQWGAPHCHNFGALHVLGFEKYDMMILPSNQLIVAFCLFLSNKLHRKGGGSTHPPVT